MINKPKTHSFKIDFNLTKEMQLIIFYPHAVHACSPSYTDEK